jgi:hypothetical protein
MQQAKEMLYQAERGIEKGKQEGAGMATTSNLSTGLQTVESKLQQGSSNAPDRKSAQIVNDLAGLVGATHEMVVETNLGDRALKLAQEAQLAAQEQGLTNLDKGKIKQKLGVKGRPLVRRSAAQIWSESITPLLRLVLFSKKFRFLVVDLIEVVRRIFLRTVQANDENEFSERLEKKWTEGQHPQKMVEEVKEKAKDTWTDEKGNVTVPLEDEEINGLLDDLLDVFAVIASDEKYHEGVQNLFEISEMMYDQVTEVAEKVQSATEMPHTQKFQQEAKALVEELSGKEYLDNFLKQFKVLANRIRDDEEANQWIEDFKSFVLQPHAEAKNSEEFREETRSLVERARAIVDKWNNKQEVEDFLNAGNDLIENIKNNNLVSNLREKAGILLDDLTYTDIHGNRQVDTDLIGTIQKAIVPILADALKYIPIPMLSYNSSEMDFTARDVVLCGYDVIPENVYAHLESDSWFSVKELETKRSRTRLVLSLKNIRTEIKDVQFTFKKKTFPQLEDSGRVSVRVGGNGASFKIMFHISQRPEDSVPIFRAADVDFDIDQLDIQFDKATINHDILLPMMVGLWKQYIIRSIERSVETSLEPIINTVGTQLSESLATSKFSTYLDQAKASLTSMDTHKTLRDRQDMLKQ